MGHLAIEQVLALDGEVLLADRGQRGHGELTIELFDEFSDVEGLWEGLEGVKDEGGGAGIVDSGAVGAVFGPGLFVCAGDVAVDICEANMSGRSSERKKDEDFTPCLPGSIFFQEKVRVEL